MVPALAGPYNLGTVVIRSAIDVAHDTRITVRTDPLPQILAGIPLRLRSVGLTLDRAGLHGPADELRAERDHRERRGAGAAARAATLSSASR